MTSSAKTKRLSIGGAHGVVAIGISAHGLLPLELQPTALFPLALSQWESFRSDWCQWDYWVQDWSPWDLLPLVSKHGTGATILINTTQHPAHSEIEMP